MFFPRVIPGNSSSSLLEDYFTYHGSLTRPPCTNTVTWLVFTEKVDISSKQVVKKIFKADSSCKKVCTLYDSIPDRSRFSGSLRTFSAARLCRIPDRSKTWPNAGRFIDVGRKSPAKRRPPCSGSPWIPFPSHPFSTISLAAKDIPDPVRNKYLAGYPKIGCCCAVKCCTRS